MNRPGLWRGLATLMCFLLALSVLAGALLEQNADAVDACLGTVSSRQAEAEDGVPVTEQLLSPWRVAWYTAAGLSGVLAAGFAAMYVLARRKEREG